MEFDREYLIDLAFEKEKVGLEIIHERILMFYGIW
jgi:hypothetical protein